MGYIDFSTFKKMNSANIQSYVTDTDKGKEILKRLKNGEDFGNLAKEKSLDNATAYKGGDLGYFTKEGEMALADQYKILSDTAFALDKGEKLKDFSRRQKG